MEFVGLPGAGKSTAAEQATLLLKERGVACEYRPSLLEGNTHPLWRRWNFLWFRLVNWRLIWTTLTCTGSVQIFRRSRIRAVMHTLFLAFYQRMQAQSDHQIVMMDQSVTQTIWALAAGGEALESSRVRRMLRIFHEVAPASIAIVAFKIDPEVAAERIVRRGRGPRSRIINLSPDTVRSTLTGEHKALNALIDHASESTNAPVVHVDGAAPVNEVARQVADFLEDLVQPSGTASNLGMTA